ncbi:enolase C-terminal domain-like protein [Allostreptomyces psammosilenae]|uniref:L-alanine-DL-glutamate epimerase-like enolase superfamily enzyme n=1 Tax=Allostreptomyces psammosilenae TaxID=1892865 RepID=A0A852ZRJ2_9ACTN|nr:enolase C-terminal domain-like protein [Allostreptomyces psammosilenae]NYI04097.1 L-alanine-DL-glutamate epimerase-like enolase superfamily enzyme [Allostreptomyces psammosilenae]
MGPEPEAVDVPVERVEARAYAVPTEAPEAGGVPDRAGGELVVVLVRADDAVGTGWSHAPAAARAVVEDLLAGEVVERGVLDIPALHQRMRHRLRDAGGVGLGARALSAVDVALWDLKAQLLGLPLVGLLGAARPEVPVYASGGPPGWSDDRLRELVRGWTVERGVPRVKIRIGEADGTRERRDLERVEVARVAAGRDGELLVDARGAYRRGQAVRMGRRLADAGVTWFEEPVDPDDLAGLRAVREATTPDTAAGGHGWDLPHLARLCAGEAVDCLPVDATRCGGPTVWLRAAAVAQAHGLAVSGHAAPNLHAHLAAAVPNLEHVEWSDGHDRVERTLLLGTLDPSGGAVRPGADGAPGHGMELRPDADRYQVG